MNDGTSHTATFADVQSGNSAMSVGSSITRDGLRQSGHMLLQAPMQHLLRGQQIVVTCAQAQIVICTDGIVSITHDPLERGDALGDGKSQGHAGVMILQAVSDAALQLLALPHRGADLC